MQTQPRIARYRDDALFLDRHRQELLRLYPDQWVAVYHQEVVASARDPRRLRKQLERKGIPPGETYWEHLVGADDILILAVSAW
jgi:hypothetical protein